MSKSTVPLPPCLVISISDPGLIPTSLGCSSRQEMHFVLTIRI